MNICFFLLRVFRKIIDKLTLELKLGTSLPN